MKNTKYLFLLIYTLLIIQSLYLMTQVEGMMSIAWIIIIVITFPMGFLPILVFISSVAISEINVNLIFYLAISLISLIGYYQWFVWFPKKVIKTGEYKDKEYVTKLVINILLILSLIFITYFSITFLKYPQNIIGTATWIILALFFKYIEYKKVYNK